MNYAILEESANVLFLMNYLAFENRLFLFL